MVRSRELNETRGRGRATSFKLNDVVAQPGEQPHDARVDVRALSEAESGSPPVRSVDSSYALSNQGPARSALSQGTLLINHSNPDSASAVAPDTVRVIAGLPADRVMRPGADHLVGYAGPQLRPPASETAYVRMETGRTVLVGDGAEVPVRYLGVWDTVKAPGLLRRSMAFPYTHVLDNVVAGKHRSPSTKAATDHEYHIDEKAATSIEYVWFAGVHSDVGET